MNTDRSGLQSDETSRLTHVRQFLWPDTASRFAQVTTGAEALLALAGVVAGLLGLFGWLSVSSERAAQWLLALGGFIALAFVVEAGERRRTMARFDKTQRALDQLLRQ